MFHCFVRLLCFALLCVVLRCFALPCFVSLFVSLRFVPSMCSALNWYVLCLFVVRCLTSRCCSVRYFASVHFTLLSLLCVVLLRFSLRALCFLLSFSSLLCCALIWVVVFCFALLCSLLCFVCLTKCFWFVMLCALRRAHPVALLGLLCVVVFDVALLLSDVPGSFVSCVALISMSCCVQN